MKYISCAIFFLSLTGCRSVVEVPLTDHLTLVVKELGATDTSFRALLGFRETTDYEEIIQEVEIKNKDGVQLRLVESFDTTWWEVPLDLRDDGVQATVTDHHWSAVASGWEHRDCRFYAGRVMGADKDSVGFAMLPQNMDGSVVTSISDKVNQRYRRRQKIKGRVMERHPETGHYWIDWIPGQITISSRLGSVIHEKGKNRFVPNTELLGDRKQRNRWRSLRMGGRYS